MKKVIFILTLLSYSLGFSQTLSNGDCFYLYYYQGEYSNIDSNFHLKYIDDAYQLFDKDSNLVFQEKFTEYPKSANLNFFLTRNEKENITYFFNLKAKKIITINAKLNPYFNFYDLKINQNTYSLDTIIVLKPGVMLNTKGEIVFSGESYSQDNYKIVLTGDKKQKVKSKNVMLKTEMDLFFEDEGYFNELSPEDYDESIKEYLVYRELKSRDFENNEFESLEEYYGYSENSLDERLYIAKQNGKFGLFSTIGKTLIPFEFDEIRIMENEDLYMYGDNQRVYCRKGKAGFIFKPSGEFVFKRENFNPQYDYIGPRYYYTSPVFNGNVLQNKKKVGLISKNGVEIIPAKYDEFDILSFKDSELYHEAENINQDAKCFNYPFENYYIGIENSTKMNHFYTPNGSYLNAIEFEEIVEINKNGYFVFGNNGFYGLAGPGACVIAKAEGNYISSFSGDKNIFIVEKDTFAYFIDGEGNKLFNQNFSVAYFLDSKFALVEDANTFKYGIIDLESSDKNIICKIDANSFDFIETTSTYIDGKQVLLARKESKYGFVNIEGETLSDFKYDKIYIKTSHPIRVC
jgi:hypothetical protein